MTTSLLSPKNTRSSSENNRDGLINSSLWNEEGPSLPSIDFRRSNSEHVDTNVQESIIINNHENDIASISSSTSASKGISMSRPEGLRKKLLFHSRNCDKISAFDRSHTMLSIRRDRNAKMEKFVNQGKWDVNAADTIPDFARLISNALHSIKQHLFVKSLFSIYQLKQSKSVHCKQTKNMCSKESS